MGMDIQGVLMEGMQFHWVGAVAPGTVGGRRAHPPKAEKNLGLKINIKERKKAIRSALGASVEQKKMLVFDNKLEGLKKVKDVKKTLESKNLLNETKVIRSGKGKLRGRKYKTKQGVLFVVSKTCDLSKSAQGLLGVDVVNVNSLNVKDLVKGHDGIRNALWTEAAVKKVAEDKLFE